MVVLNLCDLIFFSGKTLQHGQFTLRSQDFAESSKKKLMSSSFEIFIMGLRNAQTYRPTSACIWNGCNMFATGLNLHTPPFNYWRPILTGKIIL
jgi:hypothetical protein